VRAFVAAAGVVQNAKLSLCNFVVEISEGFWQFLIVRCGCSPFSDLQNYVLRQCLDSSTIRPTFVKIGGGMHENHKK
jgi:hypothetical protein